jgi:ABC-type branched-subunit amino acid transport system ATPase component/branched-subunit amino acid ABC-type transport system permease component
VDAFLPFIVIGLATGSVYGLAATGLVLTYKTSGIFNFAYGAVSALAVFLYYFLHVDHGVPWPIAVVITLVVMSIGGGLGLELLARLVAPMGATIKVVATVGIILLAEGIGLLWYPSNPPTVPTFLPQQTIRVIDVNITWAQIILFVISVFGAASLYWFFRYVRLGVAMRGVVDNPDLTSMTGESPIRVRRWAWIIGTLFASIAGLLLGPNQLLSAASLTTLIFAAFGAAAIGFFSSLPLAFGGGLLIGVLGALADKYAATEQWLAGVPPCLPFIILFVVLVTTPRAKLQERRVVTAQATRPAYHAPPRIRLGAGAIAIAVAAIVPLFVDTKLPVYSAGLIYIMIFLSLGLLVRTSGQISLCHLAFAAVGAAAFGRLTTDVHLPWLLALVLAMVIVIPVAAIVAIPAIRLSGVFLALATLGFGIILEELFYNQNYMFGLTGNGIADPRPTLNIAGWHLDSDRGFYYLLLVIALLVVAVVISIGNGRLGRVLTALADSPVGLETLGADSNVARVLVFCISAAIAALAGALLGMLYHFGVGAYFSSFTSLELVAIVVIITVGEPWYAVIAGVTYSVIPAYITGAQINTYLLMLFGVGAVLAADANKRGTVPQAIRRFLDRLGGRAVVPAGAGAAAAGAHQQSTVGTDTEPAANRYDEVRPTWLGSGGLEVTNLSVRFGGIHAVDNVDLSAPIGRITGLVGPNGAGKTTTFNACSGLVKPSAGYVTFNGARVGRMRPSTRSRLGLGRTFQRAQLFDSLTVLENIQLGREASMAGRNPLTQLRGSRHSHAVSAAAAEEAIELTGISHLLQRQAGLLPAGHRRLVELARVLAGPFNFLLLDEPSSGLDATETQDFGEILLKVVAQRDAGILLVEHDMALVRQVCSNIYILDFGSLIFEGSPSEMLASDAVRTAYLGTEVHDHDQDVEHTSGATT